MLQTIGQSFQEMLAGRIAQDVIDRVQSDWEEYHQELAGGWAAWPRWRRAGRRRGARRAVRVRAPGRPRRVAYLYLAPAFVFYLLFAFGPLAYTTWLSFFEWDGLTVGTWIGLDNYEQILSGDDIRASFVHSFELILFYALLPVALGLLLASLITHSRVRGVTFFRAVLFHATDDRARDRRDRLDVDLRAGGAAQRGARRGRPRLGRAAGSATSPGRCRPRPGRHVDHVRALPGAVPGRHPEDPAVAVRGARVDGAGRVREFFAVTLPGLRGELAVALTLTTIMALRTFDLIYVSTQGGPGTSTTVPSVLVYQNAFSQGRVGLAASIAVVLTADLRRGVRDHPPRRPGPDR